MADPNPKVPRPKAPRPKGPQQRASGRPSPRSIVVAFVGAAVVAAALVAGALGLRSNSAPSAVNAPVAKLDGIPQSGRTLGQPTAKVELIEFADPQCPACRYYSLSILPTLVDEYVRTGKVRMQYHVFPFIGSDSVKAARFVLAAGLQNRLWQLHEALYRHQGAENSGWVTDELVRRLAGEIPGLDVDKLFADAKSARIASMLASDVAQVRALGLGQTPSILLRVGSRQPYLLSVPLDLASFRRALDDALKG